MHRRRVDARASSTPRACDPRASVVVEACAGSGKTWLLVGRIVRALLDGAAPGEILAITFTAPRGAGDARAAARRPAGRWRRPATTRSPTGCSSAAWTRAEARAAIAPARGLYERVATARGADDDRDLPRLVLAAGLRARRSAPACRYAPALLRGASTACATDAWLHFSAAAACARSTPRVRAAWEWLLDDVGETSARKLLMQFLGQARRVVELRRRRRAEAAGAGAGAAARRPATPIRARGCARPTSSTAVRDARRPVASRWPAR
ncbi:MAG: UvrD-helicase domain-containing protein [Comamonadaceae bacterium]|nr:UvrD-helicase domain-containing protein [Comamonadaceae bacterium]